MTYGYKIPATPSQTDVKECMARMCNLIKTLETRSRSRRTTGRKAQKVVFISLTIFIVTQLVTDWRLSPDGAQVRQGRLIHALRKNPERLLEGNTVGEQDLLLIRGIGPSTASHWIRIREYLGSFPDTLHLRLVPGIGINRLQQIESQVIVKKK